MTFSARKVLKIRLSAFFGTPGIWMMIIMKMMMILVMMQMIVMMLI